MKLTAPPTGGDAMSLTLIQPVREPRTFSKDESSTYQSLDAQNQSACTSAANSGNDLAMK
jgi:hypothetical protein